MTRGRTSIIIPMFNAAPYISETLHSVRNQKNTDWELIIVDDGSTDSSAALVQDFISRSSCAARLLHHPNQGNRGTSASRNLGMKHATGEFLCFLDADDVWEPDFLDYFSGIFARNPEVSMAFGPALLWYMDQNPTVDHVQQLGIETSRIIDSVTLFQMFLVGAADTPSPSGVMFRHSALLKAGGWEESFPGMYDDQVLYSKLLLGEGDVYVTGKCLYRYRQHAESLCKQAEKEKRQAESRLHYLTWLQRYLLEKGAFSADMETLLCEHRWYAQRAIELDRLAAAGWWRQKKAAINSFIELLRQQKDVASASRLGRRILGRQLVEVARAMKTIKTTR